MGEDISHSFHKHLHDVANIPRTIIIHNNELWYSNPLFYVNMVLVGIPNLCVMPFFFLFNLVMNVSNNKFWAHGNVFFIIGTVYLFIQLVTGVPTLFEIDYILNWIRKLRAALIILGNLYNNAYIVLASTYLYRKLIKKEDVLTQPDDPVKMIIDIGMIYALALGAPSFIVNLQTGLKELQMQIFTVGKMSTHITL